MSNRKIKILSLILSVILVVSLTINVSAGFSDVPASASYKDALNRLTSMGIIGGNEKGEFRPDDILTREQFAKIIITAAGLEDTATALKGSTVFPDVNPTGWSSGFINAALDKGYITGMPDGKFHPQEGITFAQACTILVRALGYTDSDVSGLWPRNYIEKARVLGIADGINLKNNDVIQRWTSVIMIDRLLDTYVKKANPSEADRTFIEATGYYTECIILGNPETAANISSNQIITDKGIFYNTSGINFELGGKYYLAIEDETVIKASNRLNSTEDITVSSAAENNISYQTDNGIKSMVLPDKTIYYYNGQKQDYKMLNTLMKKNTSIVFSYNKNKTGYDYAVIFDPVYSKPQIATNFIPASKVLGTVSFKDNPTIIKDGEPIDISQIEENNVVYQVSDVWERYRYILVVDNEIAGKITAVLPDKLSPRALQVDNINYDFSKEFDTTRVSNSYGAFDVDNNVIVLLGYDGKIVDVKFFGTEDNSNYAVVLNNDYTITTNVDGTKKFVYSAKLLFSDGIAATYNVTDNAYELKGKLVKYSFIDDKTVSLEQIPYNFPGEVNIKKDDRMIDSSYVADNVKIFNVVFNDQGREVQANLLNWSDLPGGTIPNGKIWYTNKTGPFDDINVIFTDDLFNQRHKTAIVKTVKTVPKGEGSTFEYTLMIEGREYTYTKYIEGASVGTVCQVTMSSSGIDSVNGFLQVNVKGTNVQAIDARRIRINDKIYYFNKDISVYYKDSKGIITSRNLSNIDTTQTYGQISLYMDSYSVDKAKVDVILLNE